MGLGFCGGFKLIKTIVWLAFNLTLCIISYHRLGKIRDEFEAILDETHDPQIYLVNSDEYWTPVHIICSTSVTDCDAIKNQYKSITSAQSFFTMHWMDTRDDDITISDILDTRSTMHTFLWVFIFIGIIGNCYKDCAEVFGKEKREKQLKEIDETTRNIMKVANVINSTLTAFMLTVYKTTVCNIFSVSEVAEDVLLLQYIPGYMLLISFIASIIISYCIFYGCCSAVGSAANNNDELTFILVVCCIILPFICLFVLFTIPYWGLSFYVLQFSFEYKSSSFGLLSPSYMSITDGLASLAAVLGIGSWFETIVTLIDECIYEMIDDTNEYIRL
eukprot:426650_1